MGNKMLIDAAHPEETRVVVCHGNRVDEFDFESAAKQQLRGNIYLAKVTRVEPSLQAAFVDYGGNRHGFLAFNEIHPDYYQIPVSDREALIAEQQEATSRAAEQDELDDPHIAEDDEEYDDEGSDDAEAEPSEADIDDLEIVDMSADGEDADGDDLDADAADSEVGEEEAEVEASTDDQSTPTDLTAEESDDPADASDDGSDRVEEAEEVVDEPQADSAMEAAGETDPGASASEQETESDVDETDDETQSEAASEETATESESVTRATEETGLDVETVTSDEIVTDESAKSETKKKDAKSSSRRSSRPRRRPYKIQEVIKRRQILLVQVVKEERGNKGAALTTYLSLAGRYCVLMPNTARGGGISRKITNARDRKRLKGIANELEIPQGMGLIIRTAGANRTKSEIRRDFDYLMRLWENVRDLTLESTAPTLVHEEGSLVKRSIRDLYSKEIESVLVEGENGYKDAKAFMRMLMPSHAKNVKRYKDRVPLFQRYQVEQQLDSMFSPTVELPSGGYIVINPTEALVSIDVNSGRATREHNIEDTALKTNLEAAEEVSRQLRLRDMAGLIVIDFIDMEDNRNNRAVEKKLKECLRTDRARIQVGRISMFGLLEMSRQRMRSGVLEGSTTTCPHCEGSGLIRSTESTALYVLRAIEEECLKKSPTSLGVKVPYAVANYIVNQKREDLLAIEERYGVSCFVEGDGELSGTDYLIERDGTRTSLPRRFNGQDQISLDETESATEDLDLADGAEDEESERGGKKKRRRRRRRGGRRDDERAEDTAEAATEEADRGDEIQADSDDQEDRPKKRRRRGKRGGRRNRSRNRDQESQETAAGDSSSNSDDDAEKESVVTIPITTPADFSFYGQPDESDLEQEGSEPEANGHDNETESGDQSDPLEAAAVDESPADEPVPSAPPSEIAIDEDETPPSDEVGDSGDEADDSLSPVPETKPRRRGWWQRRV